MTGEKTIQKATRRDFVKGSMAAGLGFGLSVAGRAGAPSPKAAGANSEVRLAICGLGGIDLPGSVGGRGRQLIAAFQKVPGAKIAALCDVDKTILEHGVALLKKEGVSAATYGDIRRVLDAKETRFLFPHSTAAKRGCAQNILLLTICQF
jgi:hypothetical protein